MSGNRGRRVGRTTAAVIAAAVAAITFLAACSTVTPAPQAPAPTAAPAAAVVDPAAPCTTTPAESGAPEAAPTGTPVAAQFDAAAGRIDLTGGDAVTLPALAAELDEPDALQEIAPGEWLLGADLVVQPGATLQVGGPDVRWLKLRSAADRFISVQVLGGHLAVDGACVTSWDAAQGRADTEYGDGRSFLLARDGAQMTIDHAELRYLGFSEVESYGLAWRTAGTTGSITNSVVSHLYYGLYTYEVQGLAVRDNEFHDNVVYGIDPHTGSRELQIERNVVHDNGRHGIILAEDCTDSVIRGNTVYRNGHHGIVLYLDSDRNLIEDNETFANAAQGININESHAAAVRGNHAYDNGEAGVGVAQASQDTVLTDNRITANRQDGVRVVSDATGTVLRGNMVQGNSRYGVYVDTAGLIDVSDNTVTGNRAGIVVRGGEAVPEGSNTVRDNTDGDLLTD